MALLASFIASAAAAPTSCAAGQQTLFSCSTGRKTIAVCGSRDLGTTTGQLQYRYGRPAAVELQYPAATTDWRPLVQGGTMTFSGGGGAFLSFSNASYRYTVYTAVGKGWGEKAGVTVEKDGRRIAKLACSGSAKSEIGPDLFARAGIAPAAEDAFDLP